MKKFLLFIAVVALVHPLFASNAAALYCTAKEMSSVLEGCNSTCRSGSCFPNYKNCTASCVTQEQEKGLKEYYKNHPSEYSGSPADEKYDSYNESKNNLKEQINNSKNDASNNPTPAPQNNSSNNNSVDANFLSSIAFNPPEIERDSSSSKTSSNSTNALGIDFSQNSPEVERAKELIGGAVPNAGDLLGGGSSNSPVNLANQSVEGGQSGGGNKGGATQPAGSSVSGKVEQSSFTGASSLNEDYGMGSCSSGNIFQQLACRAGTIGSGLKSVAYMIAGFGLIVFSFAAIFGKVKWPLFATIMFSCFLLSATVFVINMMTKSGDASWIGGIKSNGSSYSASTAPAGNIDSNEVSKTDS